MYFTSSADYASVYARPTPKHSQVFLVSLVVLGNVYPVTELPATIKNPRSLNGAACKTGYQSHYVEVKANFNPARTQQEVIGDEIVAFEGWQALPLFLVYTSEFLRPLDGSTPPSPSLTPFPELPGQKVADFLSDPEPSQSTEPLLSLTVSQGERKRDTPGEEDDWEDDEDHDEDYLRGMVRGLQREVKSLQHNLRGKEAQLEQQRLEKDEELARVRQENETLRAKVQELQRAKQ